MPTFTERLKKGWNAFLKNKDPSQFKMDLGVGSYYRPDRLRLVTGNDQSIINAVYARIAMDVASINVNHVKKDTNGRFLDIIPDGLNTILNTEANIDQTGRAFIQDVVMSMFDEGCVAIVPIDTDRDPTFTDSFEIESVRTGKIIQWYPRAVKVKVYNDRTGEKEEITMSKRKVAIVENPFYSIMNEPNSLIKRLINKLVLLDYTDEQNSSGKLDLIIQLPYVIKSEMKKDQAEIRRKEIEAQLTGSKYGIAYIDGTEKITQLSHSIENQLLAQIEYLTKMLYAQLGLTEEILNGTAREETMLNYYNRTIEPVIFAITSELERKFLTKTARTQRQGIMYYRDPFKLVPVGTIAEMADKFTRNEIMSSNEIRGLVGFKPVNDPKANELRNKNINQSNEELAAYANTDIDNASMQVQQEDPITEESYNNMMGNLDDVDRQLDELERSVK